MSITDELRDWASNHYSGWPSKQAEGFAIADRIDAEHQKALDEWKAEHGQMWLKGYSECHAELLEGNETLASDLERCGWIRLPKDTDGEYIHIGDVMVYADGNTCPMKVVALVPPSVFLTDDGPRYADMCRHYHEPTVEDVLREMREKMDALTTDYVCELIDAGERTRKEDELFADYAKRLRLATEVGE